ncbi:MAG: S-methyl-5-thioribose-1-phosphate isomerase [Calditrichia bacterium]
MDILEAVRWENNALKLIDQTTLPDQLSTIECTSVSDVWDAIKKLKVRGAPAIGIAAGYGVLLSCLNHIDRPVAEFVEGIRKDIEYLKTSRPTAVNLFYVLDLFESLLDETGSDKDEIIEKIRTLALHIHRDDKERCERIAQYGQEIIPQNATILTHCNTGALATGGIGTALGVIYQAQLSGKNIQVFADETRPLLQGSRLTAYELKHAGIPVRVIADNMAASLMQQEKIDVILVGADRIAANGDTANKIGTYSLAVNAYYHDVPFYIVAPLTTFDISIESGEQIPIEFRADSELIHYRDRLTAPGDVDTYNPAFDVTPHELITGIITDQGIIYKPNRENVYHFVKDKLNVPKDKELL